MPVSYRVYNHIIQQTSPLQGAKTTKQTTIDSQSYQSEGLREGSEGKWSKQQNLRFCLFVHYFQDIFASKHKRKTCKIFKPFAQYLASRSSTQCRSHFQKMMEKHKSITKMKKYYKDLKGETSYRKFFDAFKMEWERNHEPISKTHPEIREFKQFAIQTEPVNPSQIRCSCGQNSAEAEVHIQPNQIVPLPFWSENASMQQITGGSYFLWIPNHPSLLSHSEVNIQS